MQTNNVEEVRRRVKCLHGLRSLRWVFAILVALLACSPLPCSAGRSAVVPADGPALKWSQFVREVSNAGCVTVNCDALKAFYDVGTGRCFHGGRNTRDRGVCCKPVVLITTRKTDCPSCDQVWGKLQSLYDAERVLLEEHVTFVDGGDPVMEALARYPYPLPLPYTQHQLHAMEDLSTFTRGAAVEELNAGGQTLPLLFLRVAASNGTTSTSARLTAAELAEEMAARAALSPEEREDLLAHETALRRRAGYAAAHPPVLQSHQWERYLRRAFAGQGDYVFRAVFLLPHNGSVMQDVFNEDISENVDDYIHFFSSVKPFFAALTKSIRVFDHVMRQEAMAHCH